MAVYWVKVRVSGDKIRGVKIPNDAVFDLDVSQAGGSETRKGVKIDMAEEDIPNSRGKANLVMSFGGKHPATVVMKSLSYEPVLVLDEWVRIMGLECRGLEIDEIRLASGFTLVAEDGTEIPDCVFCAESGVAEFVESMNECVYLSSLEVAID